MVKEKDLLEAYKEYVMDGTDQPDIVWFEGPCPACGAKWIGIKSKCEVCNFPYEPKEVK